MPSELITERRGSTLVLSISDPATRNTISEQVCSAGIEALNVAEADGSLRCVVLQGAGAHFSAGAHLGQLLEAAEAGPGRASMGSPRIERLHEWIEAIRVFPKPVLAAVEGTAAGSGFALALACDLIVAAEDARMSAAHARFGLPPDGGVSAQLLQLLPRQLALQMMWLGDPLLSPRQLQMHGIVNVLAESGQALDAALQLANRLAQLAPGALASVKELVYQWPPRGMREQMAAEAEHFLANLRHPNAREGIEAFLQKRPPEFGE